jgi:hypothetical protein
MGGMGASRVNGVAFDFGNTGYASVTLLPGDPDQPRMGAVLFAPSHVPSPPIEDRQMVILRVMDTGLSVNSPASLVAGRVLAAHVYLDETT